MDGSRRSEHERIGRRALLMSAVGGVAWWSISRRRAVSVGATPSAGALSWSSFIDRARALAARAAARGPSDDPSHLARLSSLLSHVDIPPAPERPSGPPIVQDLLLEEEHLIVGRYTMAPGARLDPHDHQGYSGAMRVVRGHVAVRQFELDSADHPAPWDTRLREVRRVSLAVGDVGTAGTLHGNIHGLQAGDTGAVFIDVFTVYAKPPRTTFFELGSAAGPLLEARRRG